MSHIEAKFPDINVRIYNIIRACHSNRVQPDQCIEALEHIGVTPEQMEAYAVWRKTEGNNI